MPECPTCDGRFDDVRSMKIHHVRAHDESLNSRECPACGETFVSRQLHTGKWKKHCSQECEAASRFSRRFTDEQRQKLRELYVEQDLSIAETAEHFDLEYSAVRRRLIAAGMHEWDHASSLPWELADEENNQPPQSYLDAGVVG